MKKNIVTLHRHYTDIGFRSYLIPYLLDEHISRVEEERYELPRGVTAKDIGEGSTLFFYNGEQVFISENRKTGDVYVEVPVGEKVKQLKFKRVV